MKLVKVAVACVNQTPFAWDANFAHLRIAIDHARAEGAVLLCLPELAITGYGCEDAFFMDGLQDIAFAQLEQLAALTSGMVVAVGLPVYHEKALYNAAALLADGKIIGFVAKQFLAVAGAREPQDAIRADLSGQPAVDHPGQLRREVMPGERETPVRLGRQHDLTGVGDTHAVKVPDHLGTGRPVGLERGAPVALGERGAPQRLPQPLGRVELFRSWRRAEAQA